MFRSADHAVAMWVEESSRRRAPKGLDPVAIRGRIYADRCPRCAHSSHQRVVNRRREAEERCARCGNPWPCREAEILKGQVDVGRRLGGDQSALDLVAELSRLIHRVPSPEAEILVLYAGYERGRDWTAARANAAGLSDYGGEPWTPERIRRAVRDARRALEAELERAGLLQVMA